MTLAHARSGHVRPDGDCEQRLVDPEAAIQQRREEQPRPRLQDRQSQIPSCRGRDPRPVTVALMTLGTDQYGRLGLDELMEDHLDRGTHHVHPIEVVKRVDQVKKGRLRQGQRVVLLRRVPWSVLAKPHTMAPKA